MYGSRELVTPTAPNPASAPPSPTKASALPPYGPLRSSKATKDGDQRNACTMSARVTHIPESSRRRRCGSRRRSRPEVIGRHLNGPTRRHAREGDQHRTCPRRHRTSERFAQSDEWTSKHIVNKAKDSAAQATSASAQWVRFIASNLDDASRRSTSIKREPFPSRRESKKRKNGARSEAAALVNGKTLGGAMCQSDRTGAQMRRLRAPNFKGGG
jgi:hypothetical protein